MKNLLILILFMIMIISCGKKDNKTAAGCTNQNTQSNEIIVSCKTLRKETSNCNNRTVDSTQVSQNEICWMGFDVNCTMAKIDPPAIKSNVANGTVILRAKDSGKKLIIKDILSGNDSFLILQQEGDIGSTSTVSLPICSTL